MGVYLKDKRTGRVKSHSRRLAKALVKMGTHEYLVEGAPAPSPAPPAPKPAATPVQSTDYSALSYAELRSLVSDRGLRAEGRKKDDLVAALEAAESRYRRRDLRADD